MRCRSVSPRGATTTRRIITARREHVLSSAEAEPTTITHRRGQTKLLDNKEGLNAATMPKLGRAAAQLARLAFELAKAPNIKTLTKIALDGLFESTQVDHGAVLLLPRDFVGEPTGKDLEIVASRSEGGHSYQRVSRFLLQR